MSLKTKILAIGALLCLVTFVSIAGCLYTAPTERNGSVKASPTPIITSQTNATIPEQPRATPDLTKPSTQIKHEQTVYNSPENGARMPDLPAYKGDLPSPSPTVSPTVTPAPIVIR